MQLLGVQRQKIPANHFDLPEQKALSNILNPEWKQGLLCKVNALMHLFKCAAFQSIRTQAQKVEKKLQQTTHQTILEKYP